jgi:site-specific recombinase XerD
MKALSASADVSRDKIFPHNLRHFFAVNYYKSEKDIVRLADLLGHSNINTTRIYTLISCESQLSILDKVEQKLFAGRNQRITGCGGLLLNS